MSLSHKIFCEGLTNGQEFHMNKCLGVILVKTLFRICKSGQYVSESNVRYSHVIHGYGYLEGNFHMEDNDESA